MGDIGYYLEWGWGRGMIFGDVWKVWWGLLIVLVLWIYIKYRKRKRLEVRVWGVRSLGNGEWVEVSFYLMGVMMMVLSLMGPKWGLEKMGVGKLGGREVVFVLDNSMSMLVRDMEFEGLKGSRFEYGKRVIDRLILEMGGDLFGLVLVSRLGQVESGLTDNVDLLRGNYLEGVKIADVRNQGTDLVMGIRQANLLYQGKGRRRLMIIVSDGEDHDEGGVKVLEEVRGNGVQIYTIGVGSREGGYIPLLGGGYQRDGGGVRVRSRLNERYLKEIAKVSGGKYYFAEKVLLEKVSKVGEVGEVGKVGKEGFDLAEDLGWDLKGREVKRERFQIFLWMGIIFWLIGLMVGMGYKRLRVLRVLKVWKRRVVD